MMSLTEVTCPHCGAHGQVMMPPVGAIIVGPCPRCEAMVVLFCGRALPLDTDTILHKPVSEKRKHLMDVLTSFLKERVEQIFERKGEVRDSADDEEDDSAADSADHEREEPEPAPAPQRASRGGKKQITKEEYEKFVQIDLPLIDNPDYFKAIFG